MEKSAFDPNAQNDLNSKIVVAMERISEAFRVLLWKEGKELGLSPIQIQILIFIHTHPRHLCKVSYLAEEFNLTKPTISDAVKSLEQKTLVTKVTEPTDTRSYSLELTAAGKTTAQKVSMFSNVLKDSVAGLSADSQKDLWNSLSTIIKGLHQSGVISVQRNCITCQQYSSREGKHYCSLIQQHLETQDLKLDCPEHVPALR